MDAKDKKTLNKLRAYELYLYIGTTAQMPIEEKGELVKLFKKYKKLEAVIEYNPEREILMVKLKEA